nr:mitochondrial phosphate carrier protein [Theileria orientalis]
MGDKWDPRVSAPISRTPHPVVHDIKYYGKCMLGGILSCGLTHTLVTPLDVTKCKMQTNPQVYKSLISGLGVIMKQEGLPGIVKGWKPTLLGYSMQGLGKFGLYEFFKDFYGGYLGEERAYKYKGMMWLAASASAEVFADVLLCPMEMVKVKVQTAPLTEQWPTSLMKATCKMNSMKAETKFPVSEEGYIAKYSISHQKTFGSLRPLLSRQVPYTMAKFYFFEKVVQLFYDHVFTKPKSEYPKQVQLGVTFASGRQKDANALNTGYLAGIICAVVSHPADSLVSQMGKSENKGKSFGQMAKEVGAVNLFTKGLGTRVLMIGTLTGLQWWIYDTFKVFSKNRQIGIFMME